ncbi:Pro-Pol polyprotein [Cyphomyrmex costatus]|uniref:Pro-Pol polyprotein n=1 Tax=Cyphomyrmex costatus TaxID=456900 RepID=A0A151IEG6_9HYME|nr:Pro-Pol polyprotein [Cyphomyrmex costatus]
MFDYKISFTNAMQKIEARRWNYYKESFDQYAIDKLALAHRLKLPQSDIINLLIGGIMKSSLRATALTLNASTVEEFLEKMRLITNGHSEKYDAPTKPLETIHLDHFGPLEKTEDGYKYILVSIDAFTRFTHLFPTKTTNSKEVCENLRSLFHIIGIPHEIVVDRGTAFTSSEFSSFVNENQIKLRTVAVASPWANGIVERLNRVIKSSLSKLIATPEQWKEKLQTVQFIINNSVHSALRTTPSKMLFGLDQRGRADDDLKSLINNLVDNQNVFHNQRETVRDMAVCANKKLREYNRLYYNERHKKPTSYKEGDYVLIRQLQNKPGVNAKFASKYKGPYVIAKVLNNNRFVVKDIPGFNITAKPYDSILSSDKLKPWVKPLIPESAND